MENNDSSPLQKPTPPEYEEIIDPLALIVILWKEKYLLILVTIVFFLTSIIYLKGVNPVYQAKVSLLSSGPTQTNLGGINALSAVLGGGLNLQGGGSIFKEAEIILASRTFNLELAQKYELMTKILESATPKHGLALWKAELFGSEESAKDQPQPTYIDVAKRLQDSVRIDLQDGINYLVVEWTDAEFATYLANLYAAEINDYFANQAVTSSSENVKFIEKQLLIAKKELEAQEEAIQEFAQKYNLITPALQAEQISSAIGLFRTQILELETEISLLRASSTKVKESQRKIKVLNNQIKALEGKDPNHQNRIFNITLAEFPTLELEYRRAIREMEAKQLVYTELRKQAVTAKIIDAKEKTIFTILDKALVPLAPIKPNKSLITTASVVAGGIVGIFIILVKRLILKQAKRWREVEERTFSN